MVHVEIHKYLVTKSNISKYTTGLLPAGLGWRRLGEWERWRVGRFAQGRQVGVWICQAGGVEGHSGEDD